MVDLESRDSPLAALAEDMSAASTREVVGLEELPFLAQVDLRGNPGDPAFGNGVEKALSLGLPSTANTTVEKEDLRALWLGPDEWLIIGSDGEQEAIITRLRESLTGQHVSIVDVSANRTVLKLSGSQARAVLEKGCLIDLHPRVFGPGQCAGTTIAKTQVFLEQTDDRPTYRLYVRCSFARHLASWLLDAMAEFNSE